MSVICGRDCIQIAVTGGSLREYPCGQLKPHILLNISEFNLSTASIERWTSKSVKCSMASLFKTEHFNTKVDTVWKMAENPCWILELCFRAEGGMSRYSNQKQQYIHRLRLLAFQILTFWYLRNVYWKSVLKMVLVGISYSIEESGINNNFIRISVGGQITGLMNSEPSSLFMAAWRTGCSIMPLASRLSSFSYIFFCNGLES